MIQLAARPQFCANMPFARAHHASATGEVTSQGNVKKDATMDATYGALDTTPWQFATQIDGGWTSVTRPIERLPPRYSVRPSAQTVPRVRSWDTV